MDTLNFNSELAKKLQREYAKAVKNKQKSFTFEGTKLLTDYAKYMLEYFKLKGF